MKRGEIRTVPGGPHYSSTVMKKAVQPEERRQHCLRHHANSVNCRQRRAGIQACLRFVSLRSEPFHGTQIELSRAIFLSRVRIDYRSFTVAARKHVGVRGKHGLKGEPYAEYDMDRRHLGAGGERGLSGLRYAGHNAISEFLRVTLDR